MNPEATTQVMSNLAVHPDARQRRAPVTLKFAGMDTYQHIWPFSDVPDDAISIYEGADVFLAEYEAEAIVARDLFAAYWLQAEFLNGGLRQFFSNDTGVLAPEAVAAIERIGLPQLAARLRQAMAWFGPAYPRERDTREARLDNEPEDPFEALDEDMANLIYDEAGGLEAAAQAYARGDAS